MIKYVLIFLMLCSCNLDYSEPPVENLGGQYAYDYAEPYPHTYAITYNTSELIAANIERFAYDSNFIIVEQKPLESFFISLPYKKRNDVEKALKKFRKSKILAYWIIDKRDSIKFDKITRTHSNVYGPSSYSEYLEKRKVLQVPDSLKLKKYRTRISL